MLPLGNYNFFAAIDPGAKGAIALMNAQGTTVSVSTMPMNDQGEIDFPALDGIYKHLARFPKVALGIEWPEAWPGSFGGNPRDNDRFGRQKGILEAFAYCRGLEYFRLPPQLWKGRLGLDGKTIEGANDRAATLFDRYYPEHRDLYRGPRGGLLDGPLDALLMAHFLRTRSGEGMKSIADKFGKDSIESLAFVLGGARRKRKFGKRLDPK